MGEAIHLGSARVRKTEELGGFVETFASGIIDGRAEDNVIQLAANMDEHGMAAADDEGNVRLKLVKARYGRAT